MQTESHTPAGFYDGKLLEIFNREIKEKVPYAVGSGGSKIVNATPLVDITNTFLECAEKEYGINLASKNPRVYAKLDSQIFGGSVKVRPAVGIIEHAILTGKLRRGQRIFEATSGNFGLALGMLNKLGLEVIVLVSRKLQGGVLDELRNENVKSVNLDVDICPAPGLLMDQNSVLAKATAANVRAQLGQLGLDLSVYDEALPEIEQVLANQDVISLAKLLGRIYGGFCPEQYDNELNVSTHETITGPEIDQQLSMVNENFGEFEILATFGTGGTATGLSRFVQYKYRRKNVHVIFPLANQDVAGIRTREKADGLRFYQPFLYAGQYDVDFEAARRFLKFFVSKGYDIGESSALGLYACLQMINYNVASKFVVLAPDGVNKYLENVQKVAKNEDPLEVTPEDARSRHDDYQSILWTHSMFAPRSEGIELVASTLGVPTEKVRVAKAKDVQGVLLTSTLSDGFASLLPVGGKVLLVCMAGNTSLRIAEILAGKGLPAQSLTGGIMGLSQAQGKQPETLVQIATE